MITIRRLILFSFFLGIAGAPLAASLHPEKKTSELNKVALKNKPIALIKKKGAANPIASTSGSAISSWEISGAMAARSKNQGWSAALNWIQRGASRYQIRLSGPLGSGTVLINKQGSTVTYRDGPKTIRSNNAGELLKRQTGVRLPVANLYYWVRGLPAPGATQGVKRDSANRLSVLRQAGYTIQYQQYTSVGKAILPSHIRLQGNGVFIKLIIKRWRV